MLSRAFRNTWRAKVTTREGAGDEPPAFLYDKLVMPLVNVCGPRVVVGAGIVLGGGQGAAVLQCLLTAAGFRATLVLPRSLAP